MDYRFRWSDRLHRKQEFAQVIQEGKRYSYQGLVLWVYHQTEVPKGPRIGLAVSRKFGIAVRRNRLKRLLREVFRLHRSQLTPGIDMVFSANATVRLLNYQSIEAMVLMLWKKADLLPCKPIGNS